MHEGPRYPGSVVVHHVKGRVQELAAKYRRKRKRATVAGAFLAAIGAVAASAYVMERFDERTRRTSLLHYYRQRVAISEETVRDLQASYLYYSQHAAAVRRQMEASSAAARGCRERLAARRRSLEGELAGVLGAAGGGGRGGSGGLMAAALAPWRQMYVRWRLDGWRRELESLDREAHHAEQSLRHDQSMSEQAAGKLTCLASQLRHEAAVHGVLRARLQRWQGYSGRTQLFSASGSLWGSGGGSLWPSGWGWGAESGGGGGSSSWNLSIEVSAPAWMDEDELCTEPPPEQPQQEEGGEEGGGEEGEEGGEKGSGLGGLLAGLRPLLDLLQGGGGSGGGGGGGGGFPRW